MPVGRMLKCEHIPNTKMQLFVNGLNQQVSRCKKCKCLLYKDFATTKWYKPHYNKIIIRRSKNGQSKFIAQK